MITKDNLAALLTHPDFGFTKRGNIYRREYSQGASIEVNFDTQKITYAPVDSLFKEGEFPTKDKPTNDFVMIVGLTRAESETEKEATKIIVLPTYREGCVPLYTLRAACGYFEGGEVPEEEGWIDSTGNGFTPDPKRHFAVHAKGDSMQPKIQDGDICVFEWYKAGTRNGEIVLTECSEKDLDYGGKYTIKKYHSEKLVTEEGWQHTKVELIPLNNDYVTIELDSEKDHRTIGVLKCVINKES